MAIDPDPYRTLGLARGATRDEVRRAYRRLAKIHHPDVAGESALPRFLAIRAAYEQLLGGSAMRARRGPSPAPRPWDADAERADATRRAYGGRARTTPPGSTGSTGSTGTGGASTRRTSGGTDGRTGSAAGSGATGSTPGSTDRGGTSGRTRRPSPGSEERRRRTAGADEPRPGTGSAGEGGRRRRNKATLGSTSYDDAEAGPFEPDWSGASWYGTTSGTYWTLNPKEYADPRKHGPEYQARARRAWGRADATTGTDPETRAEGDASDPVGPEPPPDAPADRAPGPAAGPTHTTSSWWESTAGGAARPDPAPPPGTAAGRRPPDATGRTPRGNAPPPDIGRAAADVWRALTDDRYGGMRGRAARAVVGWLPIAFGLGWLLGEITGCGRFAATCDGAAEPMILVLQVGVLAALLAIPAVASVATTAALVLLGAAIVATLILSATGEAADGDARRATLGVVLLIAWLAGLAIAVMRRVRTLSNPGRPVS